MVMTDEGGDNDEAMYPLREKRVWPIESIGSAT